MRELRFHLDENVSHAVARALQKYDIDVTTTPEAGLRQHDDLAQIDYTRREGRVLITHDADFLRLHARGTPHAGIAYCQKGSRTVGQLVETLRLMYELLTAVEMINRVEYL